MTQGITESAVDDAALGWLEASSYAVPQNPDIAGGEENGHAHVFVTAAHMRCVSPHLDIGRLCVSNCRPQSDRSRQPKVYESRRAFVAHRSCSGSSEGSRGSYSPPPL